MAIARFSTTNDVYIYKSENVYVVMFPEYTYYSEESFDFLSLLDRRIPLEIEIAQTQIRRMEMVDSDDYIYSDLRGAVYNFETLKEVSEFLKNLQCIYPKIKIDWNSIQHRLKE